MKMKTPIIIQYSMQHYCKEENHKTRKVHRGIFHDTERILHIKYIKDEKRENDFNNELSIVKPTRKKKKDI